MAPRTTGISRELLIHPGETIADILNERNISQLELATCAGVSPAYVCNVISGKKSISARFAQSLEYVLGVPKSFWLNLQANYEAELLEVTEFESITDEERSESVNLTKLVSHLSANTLSIDTSTQDSTILSLRRCLKVSNIANVKNLLPPENRDNPSVNPYIEGAWIRMCQINVEHHEVSTSFNPKMVSYLIEELKSINNSSLTELLAKYGIDFNVTDSYKDLLSHGYIMPKSDGVYQITISSKSKDDNSIRFALMHEIGHIVNGDVSKRTGFLDLGRESSSDKKADDFAYKALSSAE